MPTTEVARRIVIDLEAPWEDWRAFITQVQVLANEGHTVDCMTLRSRRPSRPPRQRHYPALPPGAPQKP